MNYNLPVIQELNNSSYSNSINGNNINSNYKDKNNSQIYNLKTPSNSIYNIESGHRNSDHFNQYSNRKNQNNQYTEYNQNNQYSQYSQNNQNSQNSQIRFRDSIKGAPNKDIFGNEIGNYNNLNTVKLDQANKNDFYNNKNNKNANIINSEYTNNLNKRLSFTENNYNTNNKNNNESQVNINHYESNYNDNKAILINNFNSKYYNEVIDYFNSFGEIDRYEYTINNTWMIIFYLNGKYAYNAINNYDPNMKFAKNYKEIIEVTKEGNLNYNESLMINNINKSPMSIIHVMFANEKLIERLKNKLNGQNSFQKNMMRKSMNNNNNTSYDNNNNNSIDYGNNNDNSIYNHIQSRYNKEEYSTLWGFISGLFQ